MNIPIVTADFETYYDAEYSLSKVTTEEYIRSPQFETIGCAIWMPDQPAPVWYAGHENVKRALHAIDWSTHAMLSHHTAFDGTIAAWRYGVHAKLYLDTMSMAQPLFGFTSGVSLASVSRVLGLGEKGDEVVRAIGKRLANFTPEELAAYGRYCVNDTVLCRRIFEKLQPLTSSKELAAIDEELRCFIDPRIVLDIEVLQEYHTWLLSMKEARLTWAATILDMEPDQVQTAIMSNDKFALLLEDLGVDPPMKISPTTGKEAFAFAKTDEDFLALKDHDDFRVQHLVECRLGGKSTLAETRCARLIEAAGRGPFPVMLKHAAALTGRLGGGDAVNMQNLPRHKYEGKKLVERSKLRDAMCAPPHHEFIVGDESQIEARLLVLIAGQQDITDAFVAYDRDPEHNPDIYCITAGLLLNRLITKAENPNERQLGKVCRLALGYGMGVPKFIKTAKKDGVVLTPPDAERIHKRFREISPYIVALWKDADKALRFLCEGVDWEFGLGGCIKVKADGLHLPSGRVLRYPNLEMERTPMGPQYTYMNRKKRVKIYGAKVVENICQSLAGSIVMDAWLRLRGRMKIVMQVHDELVGLVHEDMVDQGCDMMRKALGAPVPWLPALPVACEVSHARRYGEAK